MAQRVFPNRTCPAPGHNASSASSASTSINDDANESCTDVTNEVTPASCNTICQ